MAIKKMDKATPAAAPAAAAPAGPVMLELCNVDRYVWRGVLYTKGVIYSATPAEAEQFLRHEEEGNPVFRRYVKKAERPKVDEIPTVVIPQPKTASATTGTIGPSKIEIGTPEEIADLGLPVEDGPVTEV
jgi:hypothetical protein